MAIGACTAQHSRRFNPSKNSDTHHNNRAQVAVLDAAPDMSIQKYMLLPQCVLAEHAVRHKQDANAQQAPFPSESQYFV
jgi:hypothetical protein